jgi:hypothetical protein
MLRRCVLTRTYGALSQHGGSGLTGARLAWARNVSSPITIGDQCVGPRGRGYLGSGKTTFVNYLLKEKHGYKFAIIENEFGDVGIDDALVMQSSEEVIEMMNGCICCTVRQDLITTIKKLVETRALLLPF